MKIEYKRFSGNSKKRKIRVIFHYTTSDNAEESINWLSKRCNGKGSVGYNCIIAPDETYLLAPYNRWFNNTGIGSRYDKDTYSIGFTGNGLKDITPDMLSRAKELITNLKKVYTVEEIRCHREVNINKPDFSPIEWTKILKEIT
jgi:hypothetical protein